MVRPPEETNLNAAIGCLSRSAFIIIPLSSRITKSWYQPEKKCLPKRVYETYGHIQLIWNRCSGLPGDFLPQNKGKSECSSYPMIWSVLSKDRHVYWTEYYRVSEPASSEWCVKGADITNILFLEENCIGIDDFYFYFGEGDFCWPGAYTMLMYYKYDQYRNAYRKKSR